MNNIIKKYIGKSSLMMAFALMATGTAMTSCSDDTLSNINTDKTKVDELDPNAQLTTALLQTYGDFSLMDTYRNYITGFHSISLVVIMYPITLVLISEKMI